MQPEKRNNSNDNDYSKLVDESIANAEERRKRTVEEQKSLSDEQLEDISGGIPIQPHTTGIISPE